MTAALELDDELPPLQLSGDPSALSYDHRRGVLYIAEGKSGTILALDGWQRTRLAMIESGDGIGSSRVGGLALAPDGTIYATRPSPGAVFCIRDSVEPIASLGPRWIRAGIVYDAASHALFTTQYLDGGIEGLVARIDLETQETTAIACGFAQPVAIAKLGPTLVVADAKLATVYRVELVDGHAVYCAPLAEDIDRPTAVCAAGISSVLVATYDAQHARGAIRQVWLDGRHRTICSGTWEPSGIAATDDLVYIALRGERRVIVAARSPVRASSPSVV